MKRSAQFSSCRSYRYALWRQWDGSGSGSSGLGGDVMFVGLNPSTADETNDDPTLRRCIAYAQAWGYGGLCMTNLFAWRATQPTEMMRAPDPVGPDNDTWLLSTASQSAIIIAAWGVHGTFAGRDQIVREMLPRLSYLRLTKNGYPEHPLYLPKTLMPIEWL
jgi:hypothetical protein